MNTNGRIYGRTKFTEQEHKSISKRIHLQKRAQKHHPKKMSSSTTDWKNNTSAMAWALRVVEGSIIHWRRVKIVDRSEHEHASSEDSSFSRSHIEKSWSSMPGWGREDELDFPTHHASEYSAGGGREDDFVVFADVCSIAADQAASRSITWKLKVGE